VSINNNPGKKMKKNAIMLENYARRYRRELDESVIPFWLKHSLDRECGGYFTCLERDGTVYDTRKYMWLQGREVWMFARLFNEWEQRPEYLAAAALGADFIRRYGRDEQGRVYFSLTRAGRPIHYQRKPYGAVFVMMGMLEYGRATGDEPYIAEAEALFWKIVEWIKNPPLLGRSPSGEAPASSLADHMVLMSMAMELLRLRGGDQRIRKVLAEAIAGAVRHYNPKRRILMERALLDGSDLGDTPDGRLFNPGHSIEVGWFLLHAQEFLPDDNVRRLALETIEGSLELGWDKEFGGLWYLMDIEEKPVLQLEHFMKLWWPHTEALYAVILAALLTNDPKWLALLKKLDGYTWQHFPDPEYGEWFGYCDRQGNPTHTCKGGNYKGFFHIPRFLMMSARQVEIKRSRDKLRVKGEDHQCVV